jgi:hypothetical protein
MQHFCFGSFMTRQGGGVWVYQLLWGGKKANKKNRYHVSETR